MSASTWSTLAPHYSHTVRCTDWFHKQPISRIFATRTRKATPTRKATREVQDLWLGAHTIQYVSTTTRVQLPSATSTLSCAATTRLQPHALYVDLAVRHDYSSPAAHALRQPRRAPRVLVSTLPVAVIYLDYAARPGASARRAARHVARRATRRQLFRLTHARCRLLRLRCAARCIDTSRGSSLGSSHHSSSTTSPTPRIRVPRHVARPVTGFVVDYSVRRNFFLRTHWLYFCHAVRLDYLSRGNTGSTSSTPHAASTSSSSRIALTIHLD
jgi:hypothetical protein